MDAFPLIILGGIGIIVAFLVLIARFYPGSGADLLDWGQARSYETQMELEAEDIEQMLEAQNRYRRKRGEQELTEEDVRDSVARNESERLREFGDGEPGP